MATIFCFTSTGNSLYTAKQLGEALGGQVRPMNGGPVQCGDDVIGFVFPVYFWGVPRMVERFVSAIEITDKTAYVFAVATSGGKVSGVTGRIKSLITPKGIHLQYGTGLVAVTNYLPEYTPKDTEEIRQHIDDRIAEIAEAVTGRCANRVARYTVLNRLVYLLFPNVHSDQYFTVASGCTGCGTCGRVCPAKNIKIEADKPAFLHNCEHCLACLHHCPVQAIDWKQKTQGKDRYRHNSISLNELIAFNSMDDK
ncbi:MAG: EFR1 family ferrodoxin [Oscillospiraceae bacterium]|nr:EFR1 family ferrodoxin [Oscillospiraceae bacterium]